MKQKMKETLTGPAAIAAYIGAIVGFVAAISAYRLGEKQYSLEHDKWMVEIIIKLSTSEDAKGHLQYIVNSGLLNETDRATLCKAFPTSCKK
jgi:hypothetical protein